MKFYLDVTRLATRVVRSSPSGIDRVEYAYAKRLLETVDTTCVFTAPMLSGAMRRARALDILGRVEKAWRLDETAEQDPNFLALRAWLDRPLDLQAEQPMRVKTETRSGSFMSEIDLSILYDIARGSRRLDRWMSRDGAEPSAYFHCSHAWLHRPKLFDWLKGTGLRASFFLHDAIPIDFPEFCSPGSLERHVTRLMTVSDHAALVVVNSDYSRRTITAALEARKARVPQIEVVPLAVGEAFAAAQKAGPQRPNVPYFLFVGNIEPRKNLLFLLAVWRGLIERLGPRAPRLVIAGRRGWENENIVDVLERSRALAPFLAEASDLTDASLARLMADATGVLTPSFAEGFSLPVIESITAGTPVIASDIDAHHEIAENLAIFADPVDGPAWARAIEALMDENSELRRDTLARIAGYQPMTWAQHVDDARALMERSARVS